MAYQVELRQHPRRDMAVVKFRASAAELGQRMGEAFGAVHGYLRKNGIEVEAPAVAYYEPVGQEMEVSAGFFVGSPITGDGHVVPAEIPACEVATTTHIGSYQGLPEAYAAVQGWMQANGHEPLAVMWEEYWSDPSTPPEKTRTDIFWPVKGGKT